MVISAIDYAIGALTDIILLNYNECNIAYGVSKYQMKITKNIL